MTPLRGWSTYLDVAQKALRAGCVRDAEHLLIKGLRSARSVGAKGACLLPSLNLLLRVYQGQGRSELARSLKIVIRRIQERPPPKETAPAHPAFGSVAFPERTFVKCRVCTRVRALHRTRRMRTPAPVAAAPMPTASALQLWAQLRSWVSYCIAKRLHH
jgi:hypothetical protein